MLPKGIALCLVLGITLIPASSITPTTPSPEMKLSSKNETKMERQRPSLTTRLDMWTKLERYSLIRREALKKQNEKLFGANLIKTRRRDNAITTSYISVDEAYNPYYKVLKTNLEDGHNVSKDDVGEMRVWRASKYAYPDNSKAKDIKGVSSKLDRLDRNVSREVSAVTSTEPTLLFYNMVARFRREVPDASTIPEYCKPFVIGQPDQRTFYSPGFPNNYPNNSDCITVLSARQGQLIKLDFRNQFDMEASPDCRYDSLEVRDGAHGYSPLINRYCGTTFPEILVSQGRHLWLRFQSDDNIEYKGFTAVYEYIPKPTSAYYMPEMEECSFSLNGTEGFVRYSDISKEMIQYSITYGVPLDCMWVITVDKDKKIQLTFEKFTLQKPNECESNFVDIFARTDTPNKLNGFCGSIADPVESIDNTLHIRFMAEPRAINASFVATFTAYREKGQGQACKDGEYDCEDNTCIDAELLCNKRFNCRYKWDEDDDECNKSNKSSLFAKDHIIVILAVFSLILFGMSVAFVFNCVKKLVNDHRLIQEHIRQSREGNLDSTGCMITKLTEPVAKINIKQDGPPPRSRSASGQLDNIDCYVPGVGEILPILLQNKRNGDSSMPHISREPSRHHSTQRQLDKRSPTKDDDKGSDSDDQGNPDPAGSGNVPEMCDMCCQTRESLFQTPPFHRQSSSDRSYSPPSVDYSRKPTATSHISSESRPYIQPCITPFSTFGYSGSTMPRLDSSQSSKDPKYKAEAVIEMEQYPEDNGNFSDPNRNAKGQHGRSNETYIIEDRMNKNDQPRFGDKRFMEQTKRHFERRPYSVETTKSAPDVIIMTKSH